MEKDIFASEKTEAKTINFTVELKDSNIQKFRMETDSLLSVREGVFACLGILKLSMKEFMKDPMIGCCQDDIREAVSTIIAMDEFWDGMGNQQLS